MNRRLLPLLALLMANFVLCEVNCSLRGRTDARLQAVSRRIAKTQAMLKETQIRLAIAEAACETPGTRSLAFRMEPPR
jgi:hypothetical protein